MIKALQAIVIEELNNNSLQLNDSARRELVSDFLQHHNAPMMFNDALFSKGIELLAAQMNRISKRLEEFNVNSFAERLARSFIERLDRNNERTTSNNIRNTTGVDLNSNIRSTDIDQLLKVKIAENVALITSVKNEYAQDVGKIVRNNVLNGERSTRLVSDIKERGNVSESRAKLIARTETAKANSQLTQLRAEALGAKTYIWSASMDERTRPDHAAMNGKLCRYDDPTVFSEDDGKTWISRKKIGGVMLQCGEDFNCRCTSMPIVSWG